YYSVPYNLAHELVEVRTTPTTIDGHGHAVTISEHRPRSHQAHLEWTPSRMVHWAQTIGPQTARLFERILAEQAASGDRLPVLPRHHPARRSVLASTHGSCGGTGGAYSGCRYQSVKSRLKNSLDAIPPAAPPPSSRHH